ncbi:l-asparaginase [Pyrenophora seminiperda CCB06]|uniref:asparaginase n=1 Tax=Pyrenophora seminiperda CCB06 TaxID=1302712 RepID=A0A3M7MDM2_9PLEO|nr:l-asparaginase [Pyrenophora seminiperda CCB06]
MAVITSCCFSNAKMKVSAQLFPLFTSLALASPIAIGTPSLHRLFVGQDIQTPINASLPNVTIFATGGTIASKGSTNTQTTGYSIGLGVQELVDAVPDLLNISNIAGYQISNVPSGDVNETITLSLAHMINEELAKDEISGVVVTHGTDTLEETAFFLESTVNSSKPVIVVGAMRPATALSADGPLNLYQAVTLAGSPAGRNRGTMIVLNDRIGSAFYTTKNNANTLDTFFSTEAGQLGVFINQVPFFFFAPSEPVGRTVFDVSNITDLASVSILYAHQDMEPELFQAAYDAGARGIVLAGVGAGGVSSKAGLAAEALHNKTGVPIVASHRSADGMVPDEGRYTIASGFYNPQKARVLLQLGLSEFIGSIATISGDLSNITAPPFVLAENSTVEIPQYWADHPYLWASPASEGDPEKRALLVLKNFLGSLRGQQYAGRDEADGVKKPLNAFLGELFLGSWNTGELGETRLISEQVGHHPPVTACYLWNNKMGIRAEGFTQQEITFSGSVNIKQKGYAIVHVDKYDEDYLLPLPNIKVKGLTFTIKDARSGADVETFDVRTIKQERMTIAPLSEQDPWESRKAWNGVISALRSSDMKGVTAAKNAVENGQRQMRKDEAARGATFQPIFFTRVDRDPLFDKLAQHDPAAGYTVDPEGGIWKVDRHAAEHEMPPFHAGLTPTNQATQKDRREQNGSSQHRGAADTAEIGGSHHSPGSGPVIQQQSTGINQQQQQQSREQKNPDSKQRDGGPQTEEEEASAAAPEPSNEQIEAFLRSRTGNVG